MSDNIDLKTLWNKQDASSIPNTKELFEKADNIKKANRNKLIVMNLVLLATIGFILYVAFNIDNEHLLTKIGVGLIFLAVISYLTAYNQLIPLLFKSNLQNSSQEYLKQLITIKRKHEFLNKVMINIYFILLSAGLFLYMLQFVEKMSLVWAIIYFVLTFGWIAFAWFYMRPRGVKKKLKPLNDMIERLEAINEQLKDSD
jgi:hypothetical protein